MPRSPFSALLLKPSLVSSQHLLGCLVNPLMLVDYFSDDLSSLITKSTQTKIYFLNSNPLCSYIKYSLRKCCSYISWDRRKKSLLNWASYLPLNSWNLLISRQLLYFWMLDFYTAFINRATTHIYSTSKLTHHYIILQLNNMKNTSHVSLICKTVSFTVKLSEDWGVWSFPLWVSPQ